MVKLFLDANIYLDFYRMRKVKSLLDPLVSILKHVIVTKQVVDEVYRNRANLTKQLLHEDYKKLQFSTTLPDTLTENAVLEIDAGIAQKMQALKTSFVESKSALESIYDMTMSHVVDGIDPISISLSNIFSQAVECSELQLIRARKRKERGNPPGKESDPLGDQISWEQLVDYSKENSCTIWIVSRDKDYYIKTLNGEVLGNPCLLNEIKEKSIHPMRFFDNLATAVKMFRQEGHHIVLPSDAELADAEKAQIEISEFICGPNNHLVKIIPNGRFDTYVCERCHKSFGSRLADLDD